MVTELSPVVSDDCCVVVRLFHSNGMPVDPFQVRICRADGLVAVTVAELPIAWQEPPVSVQLASQFAVDAIDTVPVVESTTRLCAVSSPHQLVGW